MKKYIPNDSDLKRETTWAFAFTLGFSYLSILLFHPEISWTQKLILLIAGLFYLTFSLKTVIPFNQSPWGQGLFFTVVILTGTFIVSFSRTHAFLAMMPIPAIAALFLPRWSMLTVSFFVVIGEITAFGLNFGWNGVRDNLMMTLSAVIFVMTFAHVAAKEMATRDEAQRLAVELGDANRKLREYMQQAEELAAVKERNRIAREIHDSLGHYLTAIHMQISAARAVMPQNPERAWDAVEKVQRLAGESLTEVRRAVATLRVTPLEGKQLPDVLMDLVESSRTQRLETVFEIKGAVRRLEPQTELAIYRLVQEGLTNTQKHAEASLVKVLLDFDTSDVVRVIVSDNGNGCKDWQQNGYGLIGLRERLHLCGGQVKISTRPGEGFTLTAEVRG